MGMRSGYLSIKASINLWESLVRSNLEYGCEVWGAEVWKEGEAIQMEMARRLLRCSSMTTKLALQGVTSRKKRFKKIFYWVKVMLLEDTRMVKQVYLVSKHLCHSKKTIWAGVLKKILDKYNLKHLWKDESLLFNLDGRGNNEAKNSQEHVNFIRKYITSKILVYEEERWKARMEKKPKLRNYIKFKKKLCL